MKIKQEIRENFRYLLLLIIVSLISIGCFFYQQHSKVQIDFSKTQPIYGYTFEDKEMPFRIAMISVLNHEDTIKYQMQLAESIGRLLHKPILVLHRKSYAEINQLLNRGETDIALISTGAYCVYGKKEGLPLLAMQERNNLDYYYGYIIVLSSSDIYTFDQLKGKRFAFVDPLSYSGYLGVQEILKKGNIDTNSFFKSFYFTYNHDASIKAVLNGFVDGAAIDSLTYDYLKKYHPDQAERLRIIKILPPRGTGPIVARKDLPNVNHIQKILLNLQNDKKAKEAMNHLLIDKFIKPKPSLYPPIN